MSRAATFLSCVAILVSSVALASAQTPASDTAVNEAVKRQADTIVLRQRLSEAKQAAVKGDLGSAAKLYEDAFKLVQRIGTGVDAEAAETIQGLTSTRLGIAQVAQKHHDYQEADSQIKRVLFVNPGNAEAEVLKAKNDKLLAEQAGHIPSPETINRVPEIAKEKLDANTKVQDAKLLMDLGKLEDAEAKLKEALAIDPDNPGANYVKDLIRERRQSLAAGRREDYSKDALVKVEQAWNVPVSRDFNPVGRDTLPVPNPAARTNLVHTGKGRQLIQAKLDRILMDNVVYDGLPLGEVIRLLNEEVRRRDWEKRGINFLINPNEAGTSALFGAPAVTGIDPVTGLPLTAPSSTEEPVDLSGILIKINPPLTDIRLADVLEAIVTVAERPIKYSITDFAVVFSLRGEEPQTLYTRTFTVDPNTFWQGLESVGGFAFGDIQTSSGGGGGGGGGGRGGGGGGGSGSGQGGSVISIPRVNVGGEAATTGGGGGGGGTTLGGQTGAGLSFITRTNNAEVVQAAVRQFFITMGVDLTPPKTLFFNDRAGKLWVRATMEELDIIQSAVEVLNTAPKNVNIKARFADIGQEDRKALGFDWFLGNIVTGGGNMALSGGSQPSFTGEPSTGNPLGFFPGTSVANQIPSSASDQIVTSGLRNQLNAPAIASLTGILTDPQFRVVIRALEQRAGVDLLSAPEVTTQSGRQAQVQIIDVQTIVLGQNFNQQGGGGGGDLGTTGGGNAAVATTLNYDTGALPFGPVLDVVPYISADGYTIQMVIIPTVTEFIGYDDPGQFIPQGQSVSGGAGAALPLTGQLPLPRFRLRQVTTSCLVWDGQTIVLGGLISEGVEKQKDKVPVLGDLPVMGRLFRSEASLTKKRNLVIFVTPTIIDPAGNRYHSDEELPFTQTSIPQQPTTTAAVN